MTGDAARYLLICNTADGLIAQLNGVGVQLQLARRMGLEPVVHLHRRSYMFGGPNPYFDAEQGPDVWSYYFEPIGPSGDELQALIAAGRVLTLSTASELVRLFRWDPDSWFMNPYGLYRSVENCADGPYPAAWWEAQRDKARALIADGTIRPRKALTDRVERFAAEKLAPHTLGLQLRGSDKFDFGVGPNLSRQIPPEEYHPHIDRYLAEHPDCSRIFVATDQRQWLRQLQADYPEHVISYAEKSLSDGTENRFHAAEEKAARGAEVIIDMLLLTRCRHLIKCHAAVGEMALVMNPDLGFVDLNYASQPMRARPGALRGLAAPAIRALSALWKRRAEAGGALEQVVALEGDAVIVDPARPRPLNLKERADEKAPRPPLLSRRFRADLLDWALRGLAARCWRYEKRAD